MRLGFPRGSLSALELREEPFEELRARTRKEVQEGCLAGAAHAVLRKGQVVCLVEEGKANGKEAFNARTLCKLHGCTKPLVACAFLTLVEQGKVKLTDPVAKYIPFAERSGSKVKPTLRHLLVMTAGLQYQDCKAYGKVMLQIRKGQIKNLRQMCEALAEIPLQAEPGACYSYSFCTDFLGRVCEKVSGKSLEAFMKEALLKPLGMKDTHFVVPARKSSRQAILYDCQKGPGGYKPKVYKSPEKAPGIMSGGGGILSYHDAGMWSTVQDYVKFCQMLLTGRTLSGQQLLRPSLAKRLWQDGLPAVKLKGWHDCSPPGGAWDYMGWSLLNTHLTFKDPPKRGVSRTGKTMWMGGGGGTYWVVDRLHQTVSVSFCQSFGGKKSTDEAKDASIYCEAALKRRRI